MSWRQAFLRQVKSESRIRGLLNDSSVELSHRLHYLQMITEKLAKGLLTSEVAAGPPPFTHRGFVRLLQTLKQKPDLRERLGYQDAQVFRRYIDSLLNLASRIEQLAPSEAGIGNPNPEYPWQENPSGNVIAPVDFAFQNFDPHDPKMIKLEMLIDRLIRIEA